MTVMTPPPGLREHLAVRAERATTLTSPARVLDGVERRLHAPRRQARVLVGVMAMAAVAAALVASLVVPRLVSRQPAPQPAAPPHGIPLVWTASNYPPGQLFAYDWQGREVGMLRMPDQRHFMMQPSPDGRTLLIMPDQGPAYLMDASGRRLGDYSGLRWPHLKNTPKRYAFPPWFRFVFGPDDTTLCVTGGNAFDRPALHILRPDGSDRTVMSLGPGSVYDPGWHVMSCDLAADRVVVEGRHLMSGTYGWTVRVVQLSSGADLFRHDYPDPGVRHFTAVSADGRWLAEDEAPGQEAIYDLSDNRVAAHVAGDVTAILAGGRLVMLEQVLRESPVEGSMATAPMRKRLSVVDTATGHTLWQTDVDDWSSVDDITALTDSPLALVVTTDRQGSLSTFVDASGPVVTGRSVRIPEP